jgi:hypothetical protein
MTGFLNQAALLRLDAILRDGGTKKHKGRRLPMRRKTWNDGILP